jgi:DNA invertase Pin-like site-specific DNA recombinase
MSGLAPLFRQRGETEAHRIRIPEQHESRGLQDVLRHARAGEVLVVQTLDRLGGRAVRDTFSMVHELKERGDGIQTLADPLPNQESA